MSKIRRDKKAEKAKTPQSKGRGLPLAKSPDVVKAMALKTDFKAHDDDVGPAEANLRKLIADPSVDPLKSSIPLTDEEKAVVAARRWSQKLMREDDRLRQTLASMIAFRRCYVVAYRELQEGLDKYPDADPLTQDYLVQSAMHQAAQPFNEHELMEGFLQSVLPWIATVVDKHTTDDAKDREKEAEDEEKARRARPVPVGFLLDVDSTEGSLARGQSLVLVGRSSAVRFVIDQIVSAALTTRTAQRFCVVRLLDSPPRGPDQNPLLITVPPSRWAGCANDRSSLAKCVGANVVERLAQPLDLLACDDLASAYTAGFIGRAAGASAGDANRRFSRWAKEGGFLFVGGLQLGEDKEPDLRAPELEQLRIFSLLRAVRVIDSPEEGKCRVNVVGSLHNWDVDKNVLEGYGRGSGLLLPSDMR